MKQHRNVTETIRDINTTVGKYDISETIPEYDGKNIQFVKELMESFFLFKK